MTISVLEKPEWISYDDVAEFLHEAHAQNQKKGILYSAGTQTGEELRARLHQNGKFYVAVTPEGELVGASAIEIKTGSRRWYCRGMPYGEIKMEGVKPQYQGQGINSMLRKAIEEYAFSRVDVLVLDTAEKNRHARRINSKRGWVTVGCLSWKTNNFYSVVMAKWKGQIPISRTKLLWRYWFSWIKTHLCYDRYGKLRPIIQHLVNR